MSGCANQNAFGIFGRSREYNAIYQIIAGSFVKQNIFALARMNFKAIITGKIGNFISINTGRINNAFSFNCAEICFYSGNFAVFFNKSGYAAVTDNFCSVLNGTLCKTQRSFKRPANTGARCPQGSHSRGKVRFFFQNLFAV